MMKDYIHIGDTSFLGKEELEPQSYWVHYNK